MKISQFKLTLIFVFTMSAFSPALKAQRVGWWNFNNTADLTAAVPGVGEDLVLVGTHQAVNGPEANDFAARIGVGSYYRLLHGINQNGGGNQVNEYSIQIDFKVESLNIWHSFFQTSVLNNNDGDFFINPSGQIGVAAVGYTAGTIMPNEWYRLVVAVDNGTSFNVFLDGELVMQGAIQDVDGRFALDNALLMFADEDAEDNDILVSELAIWDYCLTPFEVEALGGFSHGTAPNEQLVLFPFLQALTAQSVIVSWHDPLSNLTKVEYGPSEALDNSTLGTSENVSSGYRWHSVQLNNLQPDTRYYYKIVSGSGASGLFHFRTLPASDFQGHIRFLLFSDTQDDSASTGSIVRAARDKMQEMFGSHFADSIQLMMHTGDIVGSGSVISQWSTQLFRPFSALSAFVPFQSVAGNHEMEHQNYYKYVKYDAISGFPAGHALFEKTWAYRLPGVLLIGLNTNMINNFGTTQKNWLDATLANAQQDDSIHFVFVFLHHPPFSELWVEGNTAYVEEQILPVLKNYSKVQQLSYGHTHAYERGVIESNTTGGDFRISCVGGGGGNRDRWGEYTNIDYPEVHISLDHHFYVFFDINLADRSFEGRMFDLGNSDVAATNSPADSWHRKLNQPIPDKPQILSAANQPDNSFRIQASPFFGTDALMSAQFQLSSSQGQYETSVFSKTSHWQNIYGVNPSFEPIDQQAGADLTICDIPHGTLENSKTYYARMRYRDQNLRWSEWSDELTILYLDPQGLDDHPAANFGFVDNHPNPFKGSTQVSFFLNQPSKIRLQVFDQQGNLIAKLLDQNMFAGTHHALFNGNFLPAGTYNCRLEAGNEFRIKKLILVK